MSKVSKTKRSGWQASKKIRAQPDEAKEEKTKKRGGRGEEDHGSKETDKGCEIGRAHV